MKRQQVPASWLLAIIVPVCAPLAGLAQDKTENAEYRDPKQQKYPTRNGRITVANVAKGSMFD